MRRLLLSCILALLAQPLAAQGRGEVDLPPLPEPIRLDGVVSDAEWAAIAPFPAAEYYPVFGGTASEPSEFRAAYDDGFLYVSCRCFESRSGAIRVNSLYRDRLNGDDQFEVLIDGFNDNETGLWFATNPAGVRLDRTISRDGGTTNDSWNTVWESATTVTGEGWFAELRIPLSSLGFQARNGRVVVGLTVTRFIARTNERVTWPAIDPQFDFQRPSMMQDVALTGVTPHRPVYFTPYLLGGVDRSSSLPAGAGAYRSDDSFVREVGADLRYDPGNNVHLDLSLNTDFAQVEADDEQVNLTRFPLFFPEKRQFFQERAGVFDFDFGSGGRLFHSRMIGLAPDRTPIRMLGGARVVARAGAWDLAALGVQTERRDGIASENLGVTRIRRRVFNPFSYAGGMVTSRVDGDGNYNVATGLDASLKVFGNDYLTTRSAATFDGEQVAPSLADRSQFHLQWERRTSRGLTYFTQLHRVGADYRPDLGFLPRTDFTRGALYGQYAFWPEHSALRNHGPGAIAIAYAGNRGGAIESSNISYWWTYEFRSGTNGWIEMVHNYEKVTQAFELGNGVLVEPGGYRFPELWLNLSPPSGQRLRSGIDSRIGKFYDGWRVRVKVDPTWNLSRYLELGGTYELNRIRFPDRDTGLDIHVAGLRVGAAASASLSAVGLLQLNSVDQRLGVNLRLRYNFREGSDLWLVYDEGFNTDRDGAPGEPRLPASNGRVLRLKLTHTLVR